MMLEVANVINPSNHDHPRTKVPKAAPKPRPSGLVLERGVTALNLKLKT